MELNDYLVSIKYCNKDLTIRLPSLHAGQWEALSHPARFKVLACGRRWGKTMLGLLICIEKALKGEQVWWVTPVDKQAEPAWHDLKRLVRQIPLFEKPKEQKRVIKSVTGGSVSCKSAYDPNDLRGAGLDYVVLDEAAYMDEEVWVSVIRPSLSDKRGGALFISTPNGYNWFYGLYMMGLEGDLGFKSFKFPTSSNPFIDEEEIREAELLLPAEIFAREYLAEFSDGAAFVFRRVKESIDEGRSLNEDPEPDKSYVMGVDLAKSQDFTVIVILDEEGRQVFFERFNNIGWDAQIERIADVARYYNARVIIDSTSVGEPIVDALWLKNINVEPFRISVGSKEALISNLQLMFESDRLRLLDIEIMKQELVAYQYSEAGISGRLRASAPKGKHDDCVIALALAAWGLQKSPAIYVLSI